MSSKPNWKACAQFIETEAQRFEAALGEFLLAHTDWYGKVDYSKCADVFFDRLDFVLVLGVMLSARPRKQAWTRVDHKVDLCRMSEEEMTIGAKFVADLLNGSNLKVFRNRAEDFYLHYELKIKDYGPFLP